MGTAHPLDRPSWPTLSGAWMPFSRGDAAARRLSPDHGPFAATVDGGIAGLGDVLAGGGEAWLVEPEAVSAPAGWSAEPPRPLVQMVADAVAAADGGCEFRRLGDGDAEAMLALATLTQPGPYRRMTHRLGRFVGVFDGDRLLAMAGTRMRLPGFTELSGVCTHPDARGRGLAAQLSLAVAADILASGARPFLHAWPGNIAAMRLYERLGFRWRRDMMLTVLKPAA